MLIKQVIQDSYATCWNLAKSSLSTGCLRQGQSRIMNKILKGPRKSSRKLNFNDSPILPSHNAVVAITNDTQKSVNRKRINMLNKVFMRHITDLMAHGAYSEALTGHGIEINRVKMAPDFKRIQVYWMSRTEGTLEHVEDLLKQHAGHLRHELSQLRVMGNVPKIDFVKDVQYTMLKLLDEKLSQADYGPDHEVSNSIEKLKHEFELEAHLDDKVKKQIEYLDNDKNVHIDERGNDWDDFEVPVMPQNVLGVEHTEIMNRMMKNMSRSRALLRKQSTDAGEVGMGVLPQLEVNDNPVVYQSMKFQREALREFLRKRQLMKAKATKRDKSYRPEWDYLEEEGRQQHEQRLKKYDFDEYLLNDEDFIEDKDQTKC